MNEIRVMHFADTHFGVETYGRVDPTTGVNTRLRDFRDTLTRGIEMAIERNIDLAVFAGDAYKARDPSQTHQREFASCIRLLADKNVPVVMLTGNHDVPGVKGRAHSVEIFRTLNVSNVHILSRPDTLVIDTKSGPIRVAAMPYLMKGFLLARDEFQGKSTDELRGLMEAKYHDWLEDLANKSAGDIPTILLGHFWVRSARLSSWQQGYMNVNEPQVSVSDLIRPEFDYVALGHIHRRQDINRGNKPPIVYCGSPDIIDFGEKDEKKGFVLAKVRRGGSEFEFVDIPGARAFIDIEVDADNDAPTETVLDAISKHDLNGAIVKLTYRISQEKRVLVREKEIRDALAHAFMVVSLRCDVQRDQVTRSKFLTDALDPATALEHYLMEHKKSDQKRAELMTLAEGLFEELRREESMG